MRPISRTAVLLALAAAAALPLAAQRATAPGRVIDLRVTGEGNLAFEASVREGERLRLTLPDGAVYAVAPVQSDATGRSFTLTLLRGRGPADEPAFTRVEAVPATLGRTVSFPALRGMRFVVDRVRAASGDAGRDVARASGSAGQDAHRASPASDPMVILGR